MPRLFNTGIHNEHGVVIVKPRLSLQSFASKPQTRKAIYGISDGSSNEKRYWRETLCVWADRYGKQTSVHGLDRIFQRSTGNKERIFWTLSFLLALYLLIAFYSLVGERYRRKQFQTVVDQTYYPTYKVAFPEITICNFNRLNWDRLDSAMTEFLAPQHHTPELKYLFEQIMKRYDNLTVYTLNEFNGLAHEPLETLNYINFTNVVEFMAWRCDEILRDCRWRRQKVNCCDIFFSRRYNMGQCLAFNSILTLGGKQKMAQDSFWPWRYNRYGRGSGLTLRVLLREDSQAPHDNTEKGIMFMTVEPETYAYFNTVVQANNIVYAAIGGFFIWYDELTRSVSSADRDCVFVDENQSKDFKTLPGLEYSFENCQYECQQQHIIAACKCTPDLFFPSGPYPVCQLIDMPCLAEKWKEFSFYEIAGDPDFFGGNYSTMNCACLFNCHSLRYKIGVRIEPLHKERRLSVNGSFVDLDFYWRRNWIVMYRSSLVFTWLDLLVSFGGIASLLLGCSMISIVELLYFLLFDTPQFIWQKRNSDKRLKELRRENNIRNLLDYDSKH